MRGIAIARQKKFKRRERKRAAALLAMIVLATNAKQAEDGLWLAPLARCQVGEPLANKVFTTAGYLTLLDGTADDGCAAR